jgi:hypothetical protein
MHEVEEEENMIPWGEQALRSKMMERLNVTGVSTNKKLSQTRYSS